MKKYKQFVEKIAPFFDLSADEGDLDALEMRLRQYINHKEADKRINPEDYVDDDEPNPFETYSEVKRAIDREKELRKQLNAERSSVEKLHRAQIDLSKAEDRCADLQRQVRELQEWRQQFEGTADDLALQRLDEMKEALLADANEKVEFMQKVVAGVVDDNNKLLVKLGASGDKEALARILENQQKKIFEQAAKVHLLTGASADG